MCVCVCACVCVCVLGVYVCECVCVGVHVCVLCFAYGRHFIFSNPMCTPTSQFGLQGTVQPTFVSALLTIGVMRPPGVLTATLISTL